MNYEPINNACWSSEEVKTETMLPLVAAFKDWRRWDQQRIKQTVEQIAILTVKRIIAEIDYLPEKTRNQCRNVFDTTTALEAAQAASDRGVIENCARMKRGEAGAIREAKWAAYDATWEASWSAAEAAWGVKRVEEATSSAAKAAANAARVAMAEKASPDNILRAACQLWIEAAS
jgi:membrane protein involved in colicin uptake